MATTLSGVICSAIRARLLISFEYEGLRRIAAPYCHGFAASGEVLRAVQVRGESRSGGLGFGKLWKVEKMRDLLCTTEAFVADDPQYQEQDKAMLRIHCHIRR